MTYLEAAAAAEAGKLIRRKKWNNGLYLFKKDGEFVYYDSIAKRYKKLSDDSSSWMHQMCDDWEVYEENEDAKEKPPQDTAKYEGFTVKLTSNFDGYMQAVDEFRCRLDDLQQAIEKLNGMRLEITVNM